MITTVTLNTAIDKAYVVDTLQTGSVQRVKRCTNTAGGKGLNVAKVAHLCGEKVTATGLAGGFNGDYLIDLLNRQGITGDFVKTEAETRTCINILTADGTSTELLEPGSQVSEEELASFRKKIDFLAEKSDVVTISGSLPSGVPDDFYASLIMQLKAKGVPVILDSSQKALRYGIRACPVMIKPNQDEIEALTGKKVNSRDELLANARLLVNSGIHSVVISLGAKGAVLVNEQGAFQGKPPKIDPVNTVGCGDSMVAALAVSMVRGYNVEETIRYAVAVSAANALTMATGHFRHEDLEYLIKDVTVHHIE